MANLKAGTTIGGRLVWDAASLPLTPKIDTIEYMGHKIYSTHDKPTLLELGAASLAYTNTELGKKVDKVAGKALSDKNFTLAYENKLIGIAAGAQVNVPTNLSYTTDTIKGTLNSTTGNSVSIDGVTITKAGLISSVDKVKLDSLPSGNSGIIPITGGGTGSNTQAGARIALQLGNHVTHNYGTAINTVMQGNDARVLAAATNADLVSGLALKADKTITLTAGTGLSGGGDLTANRTFSVNYGTAAGTAAQGNDSRINNGQAAFVRLNIGATAATARTALELGNHVTHNYGTTNNSVMQGNDARVLAAATNADLVAGLALKANHAITLTAGTGLSGGGNLTANRSFSVNYGTAAGTAAQGNDTRINNGQAAFVRLNIGATAATARTALQLGNHVTHNYGTAANTIAMGNDARIVNAASVAQMNTQMNTKVDKTSIKQTLGNSTTDVMSQKAVSDSLIPIENQLSAIPQSRQLTGEISVSGGVLKILNRQMIFANGYIKGIANNSAEYNSGTENIIPINGWQEGVNYVYKLYGGGWYSTTIKPTFGEEAYGHFFKEGNWFIKEYEKNGSLNTYEGLNASDGKTLTNMINNELPYGKFSASSIYSGDNQPYLVTLDNANHWATTNGVKKGYISYEYFTPVCINKYKIRVREFASSPKTWKLFGSNSGKFTGEEVLLDTRENQNWPNLTDTYSFSNDVEYNHYRLDVSENNGGDYVLIVELSYIQAQYKPVVKLTTPITYINKSINIESGIIQSIEDFYYKDISSMNDADFKIIYPNGGSEKNPSLIYNNNRFVDKNPFGRDPIITQSQILIGDVWADTGWLYSYGGHGVKSSWYDEEFIVTRAGGVSITSTGNDIGTAHLTYQNPAAVRVLVWRIR